MTDDQYQQAALDFIDKYNAPVPKPVSCLNLIMRKEFAEAILRGEKKVEIRSFSDHYFNRLTDKAVDRWMDEHRDDKDMDEEAFEEFMCSTRPVMKIHFYNYNNSWYLDVECTKNALIGLTRQNVETLQEEYGFHELDDMLADFEVRERGKKGEAVMRPLFYYFAIGKVLGTNLRK